VGADDSILVTDIAPAFELQGDIYVLMYPLEVIARDTDQTQNMIHAVGLRIIGDFSHHEIQPFHPILVICKL